MSILAVSSLTQIIPRIATQLSNVLFIPTERILIRKNKNIIPTFQGDQDIVLFPGNVVMANDLVEGAGRYALEIRRILYILLRTRLGLDMSNRDDSWITDTEFGHFITEEGIILALHNYQPEDIQGNVLTQEVIQWIDSSEVAEMSDSQWGSTVLRFSMLYRLDASETL